MRKFEMTRIEDETGVSGRGKVVEGIVFSDGVCVTRWVTEASTGRSTNVWDSYGAFVSVHITPHPTNKTLVTFDDGEVHDYSAATQNPVRKPRKRRKAAVPEMAVEAGQVQDGVRTDAVKPEEVLQPKVEEA
jgi:hypothetical protein